MKDKAVIVLRHEPEQDNPHSVFNGQGASSEYAAFSRKVSNAYEHGAQTVNLCQRQVHLRRVGEPIAGALASGGRRLAEANTKFKALESPDDDLGGNNKQRWKNWPTKSKPTAKTCVTGEDPLLAFEGPA